MLWYYFPPAGFGFWYQLGILENIDIKKCKILGSSAGSLICVITLLNDEDKSIENIIKICESILNNINEGSILGKYNLFNYVEQFLDKFLKIIEKYPNEIIEERLNKIFIKLSCITYYYFIPYLNNEIKNPKSLEELRNLVLSSCYVPIISYNKNPFFLEIEHKK